jgi:Ca2+-binding RTX toxin-like protein
MRNSRRQCREGGDFINVTSLATVVGGNDSADGNDSIFDNGGGTTTLWAFGNGGSDTFDTINTSATLIGGFGGDSFFVGASNQGLYFGNEGNDSVNFSGVGTGVATAFGGQGNDSIWTSTGRDTIQGNEGNDTLRGDGGIDTISGGTGNDVFAYVGPLPAGEDGNNATGGGPVEWITDVDFSVDRFQTFAGITFATNTGAGTGTDLASSANNAINGASALAGGALTVAAQFTFSGRTYLAINLANAGFLDADDLLLDITGATGAIGSSNFI